jgi:hypothetical protein
MRIGVPVLGMATVLTLFSLAWPGASRLRTTDQAAAAAPGTYAVYQRFKARCGDFPCTIVLRWGNSKFGYRHIKRRHGYTRQTEAMIRRTLTRGRSSCLDDFCMGRKWELRSGDFYDRVIVSDRVVRGRKVGIITAYSGCHCGGGNF